MITFEFPSYIPTPKSRHSKPLIVPEGEVWLVNSVPAVDLCMYVKIPSVSPAFYHRHKCPKFEARPGYELVLRKDLILKDSHAEFGNQCNGFEINMDCEVSSVYSVVSDDLSEYLDSRGVTLSAREEEYMRDLVNFNLAIQTNDVYGLALNNILMERK